MLIHLSSRKYAIKSEMAPRITMTVTVGPETMISGNFGDFGIPGVSSVVPCHTVSQDKLTKNLRIPTGSDPKWHFFLCTVYLDMYNVR